MGRRTRKGEPRSVGVVSLAAGHLVADGESDATATASRERAQWDAAARIVLAGDSVAAAARAVGVTPETLTAWRSGDSRYREIEGEIRRRFEADQWATLMRWVEQHNGRLLSDTLAQALDPYGDPRTRLAAKKFLLELQGRVQARQVNVNPVLVQFNVQAAARARQLRGEAPGPAGHSLDHGIRDAIDAQAREIDAVPLDGADPGTALAANAGDGGGDGGGGGDAYGGGDESGGAYGDGGESGGDGE